MNASIKELYSLFRLNPYISTDTRQIRENAVFFALKGQQFDGNQFAQEALAKGCALAVVDDPKLKGLPQCFWVEDSLKALQQLAVYHRQNLHIPVIAITGTNGKTTTKELMAAVLAKKYHTFATKGNLNNHIGVPLSILSINDTHEIAIIEMGANHIGEIDALCQIAQPVCGLITNIGKAHLEGFGSIQGIIRAKTELYKFLATQEKAIVFVNTAHPMLLEHASALNTLNMLTYGINNADCMFSSIDASPYVSIHWNTKQISTRLIGKYNAENVMAAVCTGHYFGVPDTAVIRAIQAYTPANQRSQLLKTRHNTIIVDAYNANPASMQEALSNFEEAGMPNKICILGDMAELGSYSGEEHQKIANRLASAAFEKVILIGTEFGRCHLKNNWKHFNTLKEAKTHLQAYPIKNASLLLKASRKMQLEELIESL